MKVLYFLKRPLSPEKGTHTRILMFFIVLLLPLLPISTLEGAVFSGIAESTIGSVIDNSNSLQFGTEQYANLRLAAPIGEVGTFSIAFNISAAASPDTGLQTYGEIERLYSVFQFDYADLYLGLIRIPFGYGLGIRPTDVINPQNPLYPDARLRGVLAMLVAWYPFDEIRIQSFAAQRNMHYFEGQSISLTGESLYGLSIDRHDPSFSIQGLALASIPGTNLYEGLLHFGFSLKFDLKVGFAFDTLVTTDMKNEFSEGNEHTSIAAAVGCDYSFLAGKLFFLVQYFYNSAGLLSVDSSVSELHEMWVDEPNPVQLLQGSEFMYLRRHYVFLTGIYNHSDYARLQLSILASLGDASLFPVIRHEIEPAQAVTLVSMITFPLDETVFSGNEAGEFGPNTLGMRLAVSFSVKYRF